MTNTQAINLLQRISLSQHDDEKREALEMAVRALEGDGDTIYRQRAIDAVVSAMIDGADAELVEGVMELLPSAQPEIIRCKDCKYYRKGHDDVYYCQFHDDDILWQDDDYCSYGKMEVRANE